MTLGGPRATALAGFRGWRALRHGNYRLFFGGQLVSLVGTWMQSVAQAWLVLQLTGDPFILGVVAAAQFSPVLVLGLFGGLVADGLPKRRTLVVTQTIQMLLAFALFALTATHHVAVWQIVLIALLLGCTNAIDMPTRQSFAVEMVGREDIGNAVALNSAMFNAARVLGPAVAGLTIGAFGDSLAGISVAFLLNGLSFLAVIVGLLLMDDAKLRAAPRMPRPRTASAVVENMAEGLGYVRRTDVVFLAVAVVGLVSTFGMNFSVVIPALARDVLHSDASGYGFLMAATGVGSFVAALGIAFSGRTGPRVIVGGALLLGLFEVVLGWSRSYPVSLIAMVFVGAGGISMAATANTTLQLTVPDRLRGRVMSVYTTVFAGSTPIGGLIMGAIASRAGVDVSMLAAGVLCAAVALGAGFWLRRIRTRDAESTGRLAASPLSGA